MDRPNVLLLTLDTLRADRLGCYGYEAETTPHIDRLAPSSVRFEQAISGGSWTQAAFPVILTSSYASMYGGCLGALSPGRPSPIQTLSDNGYQTAGFSTSPLLSRGYGYHRGFGHFVDLSPEESDPFLRGIKGGQRLLRCALTHSLSALAGIQTRPARLYASGAKLTDHVCHWIERTKEPFFLWAHYMDIHWPYHREETLQKSGEIAQAWRDLAVMHAANWKSKTISSADRSRYRELYDKAVGYTDRQVGRLIDFLEKSGQLANTIIILVSDHGEEFLERRYWGHFESNLHDEILKVPLLVRLPQMDNPCVIRRQVRTLDIMPTVLDLCGCFPPHGLEGKSLTPLWSPGKSKYDVEISISEMWRNERHIIAVRTEQFKYIWDSSHPDQPQLYDLETDPGEQRDVLAQFPDQARALHAHLEEHLQRVASTDAAQLEPGPDLDTELMRRLRDLGYVE